MAVLVTFSSERDKDRAVDVMLDNCFPDGAGFLISALDEEVLKQKRVEFEGTKPRLEVLSK